MSGRFTLRRVRRVVRACQCSRLEQEDLGRAYEWALPVVRKCLANRLSAKPRLGVMEVSVPQQRIGG